jgi:hypothetical protein
MEKLYNLLDVERDQLWNVRIVENGDSYGRDMCLTHDEADPLVEFYDADVSFNDGPKDIGMKLGQFVSRYYMSTLMDDGDPIGDGRGFCLDNGVPKWVIEGAAMKRVARFLDRYQKEVA